MSVPKLIKAYQLVYTVACFTSALHEWQQGMTCLLVEKMIMIDLYAVGHNSLLFQDYSLFYAVGFTRTKFMDSFDVLFGLLF